MKKDIHPKYEMITANCSCGNSIQIRSTVGHDLNLDVCGKCHPFYTGKQRDVATGGRVDRFNKRFSIPGAKKRHRKVPFLYPLLSIPTYPGQYPVHA